MKLENNLEIDLTKCTKCGACIAECPAQLIEMTENGAFEARPETCIDCGHCVAICPVSAITHIHMDGTDFLPKQDPQITYEQLMHLNRNRRSIRAFKPIPVPPSTIEQIIHVVKYCPTGENAQELKYLAISDPLILKNIQNAMFKKFNVGYRLVKNGFIRLLMRLFIPKAEVTRLAMSLQRIITSYQEGKDPFLRGSPALIIIYCYQKTAMASLDAGIAGHQACLTAETLGLGTVWIGFHSALAQIFKSVKLASMLPKKTKILATIGLGYPKFKYKKTVARRPVDFRQIIASEEVKN
jgi:nitroreductase/NAD-dependent dihydropyrimidine dehydrogenase PreA subunit